MKTSLTRTFCHVCHVKDPKQLKIECELLAIPINTHAVSKAVCNLYLLQYYNVSLRLYFESHYILKYPCLSESSSVMMSRSHWVVIGHALPTIIGMSQHFSGKCKYRKGKYQFYLYKLQKQEKHESLASFYGMFRSECK